MKTIIILIVVIAVIAAVYYFFKKPEVTTTAKAPATRTFKEAVKLQEPLVKPIQITL